LPKDIDSQSSDDLMELFVNHFQALEEKRTSEDKDSIDMSTVYGSIFEELEEVVSFSYLCFYLFHNCHMYR